MKYLSLLVSMFGIRLNGLTWAFEINGCLTGWMSNGDQCYLFSQDPKIIEEADSYCWKFGAKLLVVNNLQEHLFIQKWLMNNDIIFRSTWFTNAYYVNNELVWDTGVNVGDFGNLWIVQPQTTSRIYNRLAYKLANDNTHSYGWALVSGSNPSNFICEMSKSDVRHYAIERDYDYGIVSADKQSLPRGPHMTVEPKSVLILAEGGPSVYVECSASSVPQSTYSWKRGNDTLSSLTDERYTLSSGRLTIESPTEEQDAGYYQCSARNEIGAILSSVAQITFGYLHAFSPVKPNDQIGTAFEGVRISCNTPAYKPAVRYGWFKNHNTHNYIFPGHPVHFISQSGYLYFSEVQYTDDRTYYCVVTLVSPAGFVTDTSMAPSRVGLGTKLIIREGKTDNNYGPIIHTHAFPAPALKGSLVRLECVAYASSPQNLKYAWHRENGQPFIKGTTLSDRNRVLEIPNAPMEAQGNYICTVTRPASTSRPGATASTVITLMLETQPYFSDQIGNKLVDPEADIIWRCKAVARPRATYSWYKDGRLITNIPGKVEAFGNVLRLTRVTDADEGMYQCSATNQHGTSLSSGELKILSFKPNFDRHQMKDSRLAPLGGNITIPCQAEGAPLPDIQWLKNGAVLNVIPGTLSDRVGMTLANDLVITSIQTSDQGKYTCKASNVNGEAFNSTFVSVVPGIVITQAPAPTVVQVNRTEFLYCYASHTDDYLDINYLWSFNGHPISFKNNHHVIKGVRNNLLGIYIRDAQYSQSGIYTCTVRTPLHADSKSAVVSVKGPPAEPAGVYVDSDSVTAHSARVVWTVGIGIDHGSPVLSYDIEGDTNFEPGVWKVLATDVLEFDAVKLATDTDHRADQRAAEVKDLVPNTSYRFRVRAVNEYGRGVEASRSSVRVKTPSTAPYRAPDGLGGGDGSEGTLNISWTPLPVSEQCGPGIGYIVYWRSKSDERMTWKTETVYGNKGGYTVMVGVENYYLPYEVMVQPFNKIGLGPNTSVEIVYSAMGMPSIVPTITSVSGINISTIVVEWEPIPDDREHIKGRVGGYTIQYYWNDQGCNPMTGCEVTNLRTRNIWGQTTQVMLIDLEMNSEFFFRLQVFNSAGRGPKGEWRRGETAGYAPLNYPRFVTVSPQGPHSVHVKWQNVMTTANEEIITGYKVKWWEVQSDIRNANETLSDQLQNNLIVYGLQKKTVYVLRVQGISAGGDGQMSNPVYFTIEGGMIRIDPATTQFCYEGVTCSSSSTIKLCHLYLCLRSFVTCMLSYVILNFLMSKI